MEDMSSKASELLIGNFADQLKCSAATVKVKGAKDGKGHRREGKPPTSTSGKMLLYTRPENKTDCGLEFDDDDMDPDYVPDSSSDSEAQNYAPKQKMLRLGLEADDDLRVLDSESDGDCDVQLDKYSKSDIEKLLAKLQREEGEEGEGEERVEDDELEDEDDEPKSPPKKWNHFIIPLEGALKNLPHRPFKALWHKLYEDPGFEVSTNGECLLYNMDIVGKTKTINSCMCLVHPDTKKHMTTSPQRIILMLACGCYDLPLELATITTCYNNRCITLDHISLEPRTVQMARQVCLERGKCSRHYNADTHSYYLDCRPDLYKRCNSVCESNDVNESVVENSLEDNADSGGKSDEFFVS